MSVIDFVLHFDRYLGWIISQYGLITYGLLFLIIFVETGIVIAPFLPGDSLLFVAGAFAAQESLNLFALLIILSIAAILGDSLNYWIGNYFGYRIFERKGLIKREYLERTQNFYNKHGGKTIILARFIPIIRTFAPFIAGVGKMEYKKFLSFNILGGIAWVLLFTLAGFFFGRIPLIRDNLSIVIILIILVSLIPPVFEYLRHKVKLPKARP